MTGFEGGQMPLERRIPKRGFTPRNRVEFNVVNVETLNAAFEKGSEISQETLRSNGIIKGKLPIKILGDGVIEKSFTVKAHAFSKSAEEKIVKAGGTIVKIAIKTQNSKTKTEAK
jgi:large subunit ribosomal protein L15